MSKELRMVVVSFEELAPLRAAVARGDRAAVDCLFALGLALQDMSHSQEPTVCLCCQRQVRADKEVVFAVMAPGDFPLGSPGNATTVVASPVCMRCYGLKSQDSLRKAAKQYIQEIERQHRAVQAKQAAQATDGKKPTGSVTDFIRNLGHGWRSGAVSVPCNGCTACCRSPNVHADLDEEELAQFPEAVRHEDLDTARTVRDGVQGGWVLPKNPDGSCVYLIDNKCSIYARRPGSCRKFDCRIDLLLRGTKDDPIMIEALQQWRGLENNTARDRQFSIAVGLCMATGGPPKSYHEAIARLAHLHGHLLTAQAIDRQIENLPSAEKDRLMQEGADLVAAIAAGDQTAVQRLEADMQKLSERLARDIKV